MQCPQIPNRSVWENYLERRITTREETILAGARSEAYMNRKMKLLHEQCAQKKLYVLKLTEAYGNCMFESLIEQGIGETIEQIRKGLACMMYIYKNHKNFFPNDEETLKEKFDNINDVEYVITKRKEEKKFYKYSYNIMCQELANNYSWGNLPTHLIQMVVSRIYKVEINIIIDSSEYVHKISGFYGQDAEEIALEKVYLGKLDEYHYLPIREIKGIEEEINLQPKYYTEGRKIYTQWTRDMQREKIIAYRMKEMNRHTLNREERTETSDMLSLDELLLNKLSLSESSSNELSSEEFGTIETFELEKDEEMANYR